MGSRLQLDPNLNLSTVGLQSGEHMIARALQVYGCYVIDSSGGGFGLFAQNYRFLPDATNPYPAAWADGISKELLKHLRVVDPPPAPVYDDRSVFGQPHR
jgi:hypothetical protein